ncbi:MAG: M50 family metallopeptidase [Candidatus Gracilibacteria bacterium]|nr:M50 family metallopeptidase [Candidatus Gracilibacteria bacterium]
MLNYLPTIIVFVIIFGLIVFIHELGHFVMARRNGIRVTEFGFGMPPRIWGKRIGETLYSINWIPIGGFVRMLGQDDFDAKAGEKADRDPHSFENKTTWQKTKVLVAGVTMNFLLAWLLFSIAYTAGIQPIIQGTSSFEKALEYKDVVIKEVELGAPAAVAGLQAQDIILTIDDQEFSRLEDVQSYIASQAGEKMSVKIKRAEQEMLLNITPNQITGTVGIGMYQEASLNKVSYPFYLAPLYALEDVYEVAKLTLQGFGQMILKIFTELKISEDIAGPIGIVQITHDVMQFGLLPLIQFAAILSVSLAVINILPFPALDGGRLLFLWVGRLLGKKRSGIIEGHIHLIGFLLLLALIVAVSYQDLMRLFG